MRTISIALLLTILLYSTAGAQQMVQQQWKFKTGDDPSWAAVEYKDAQWQTIKAGELWESQGYNAYDGFAWYRSQIIIPSSMKSKAEKYGGFILNLAKIDDADEAFFNGIKVGQTGKFPPEYEGQYNLERAYEIPMKQIQWDKANTIAVRVFDNGGGGGIYDGVPMLTVKDLADLFSLRVALASADHIYRNAESIVIPVVIKNESDESFEGNLNLEVITDFKKPAFEESKPVGIKQRSEETVNFVLKGMAPGFYLATAIFKSDLNSTFHKFAIGVDPEKVISPPDPADDFELYWQRAKKELAAVDPQYKLTKLDNLCTPTRNIYLLEMRSLGNVLIRAWYGVPTKPGKYPAILHVQGYSTYVQAGWMYQGDDFVTLGLNIRGHGNSCDNINPGFPGYLLNQLHDKEMYIYRGAYMDCIRAVDFLCSRPEVDTKRIVVEGGSQGGALSFATAALDNQRIRLCAPAVPFLSDFRDYFQVAAWPGNEFTHYVADHPETSWEKVYHTLSYIDIKNLAPRIKAPVYMFAGLMDETCPPHINFAAYNNLTTKKQYKVYPYAGHNLPDESNRLKFQWIKQQLGME
jgi:cephalosporin-C deacetylase